MLFYSVLFSGMDFHRARNINLSHVTAVFYGLNKTWYTSAGLLSWAGILCRAEGFPFNYSAEIWFIDGVGAVFISEFIMYL